MAVPLLNALTLARDALAVGAIAFGLSQCFAGLKLFDQFRRLPGALAGLVLAGLAAWFLWGDPLPTITAAALGAVAGWWVIGAYDDLILRGSAAAVGALVGAGIAALLVLVLQISLSPSALLALVLAPTVLAAALAVPYRNLIITLATGFGGAALVVGGAAWLTLRVSAQQPDPGFFGVTLLGWLALGVVGVFAQYQTASKSPVAGESAPAAWAGQAQSHGQSASDPRPSQKGSRTKGPGRPHPEFVPKTPSRRRAQALTGHGDLIYRIVWDPTGRWFATCSSYAVRVAGGPYRDYGEIYIWHAETGQPLHRFRTGRTVKELAVSPDGRWLASPGDENVVLVWDASEGSLHCRLIGHQKPVRTLLVDPDGRWLGTVDGERLLVWDWQSFKLETSLNGAFWGELAVVPRRGKLGWIASEGSQSRLLLRDIATGLPRKLFSGFLLSHSFDYDTSVNRSTLVASQDGRWLAFGDGRRFKLWEIDGAVARNNPFLNEDWIWEHGSVTGVAFDPQSRWVTASSQSGGDQSGSHYGPMLQTLALPSAERLKDIALACDQEERWGTGFALSPDGSYAAIGGRGGLCVVDPVGGRPSWKGSTPEGIYAVAPSPSGGALAAGSSDGRVLLWQAVTGSLVFTTPKYRRALYALAISADGCLLASGGSAGTVRIWEMNADTPKQTHSFECEETGGNNWIEGLAIDPGGDWVAATPHLGQSIRAWDLRTRSAERIDRGSNDCTIASLPPGGPMFAGVSGYTSDTRVFLFEPGSKTPVADCEFPMLDPGPDEKRRILADPAGRWLALGGQMSRQLSHGEALLWILRFDRERVSSTFSITEIEKDATFLLGNWQPWTDDDRHPLKHRWVKAKHRTKGRVLALAVSPDGRWLASAGDFGGIWLWDPNARGKSDPLLRVIKGKAQNDPVRAMAAGSGGAWLAAAGDDATIRFWNPENGRLLQQAKAGQEAIHALAADPKGRWLFSAGDDGLIRRWVLTPGLRVTPHCDLAMEPLPEGDWVVWQDPDGPNRCWVPGGYSEGAERWLGYHEPSADGSRWEHRPLAAASRPTSGPR